MMQVSARERGDVVVDDRELLWSGEEHHPEKALIGGKPEPGAVNAENARLAKQRQHEVLIGPPGRKRYARHRVKPGARPDAPHTRDARKAVGREIGPLFERPAELHLVRAVAG